MKLSKIKNEDKWLYGLLILSIIIIGCTDFWFDEIPAYAEWIYKLGRMFNNLSLAYISSIVFYWIIFSIPENRKKRNIYEGQFVVSSNIIGDCQTIISQLEKATSYVPSDPKNLTVQDFEELLKINPYGDAPLLVNRGPNIGYATWVEYLNYQRQRSQNFINEKVVDYFIFLETDYVKLIQTIKSCNYFTQVQALLAGKMRNPDLNFMSDVLHEYYLNLKKYRDKTFFKYAKKNIQLKA
jgi:hypothetical protein